MTASISAERIVNDLPSLSSPQASPDGSTVAFVRGQVNPSTGASETAIWLCDVDGGNQRRITWTSPSNGSPIWSPDGQLLAFVTAREEKAALAVLDLKAGGEARIVTSHAFPITGVVWSPDGSSIAYTVRVDPENPNETPRDPAAPAAVRVVKRVDYKHDVFGFLNDVRAQLFIVDVASGKRRQLTSDPVDHFAPVWSPDGSKLALQLPTTNGFIAQLGIIDVASGEVTRFGAENITIDKIRWTPDGSGILHNQVVDIEPAESWYLYDVASGASRQLTGEVDFMAMGEVSGATWLDSTRAIIHGLFRARAGLWSLDIESGEIRQLAQTDWLGLESTVLADRSAAIVAMTSLDGVVALVKIDLATGEETVLFDDAADFFAETPRAQWELVQIERNGLTIEGWLFKPADFDPGKRYPLVLDVHGGPNYYHAPNIDEFGQVYATNGMLVLKPNPRGSGTYGPDFAKAVIADWGGEDWLDLQAILDHVIARPYVDADRTGIFGYSYGGYMTSWAIGHTDRFKAAVCGAPCFDFESFFGTSDIGSFFNSQRFNQAPWEDRDVTFARSPSEFIHNAVTPTLIIHGEADERCPIGQGEQLFISLKKLGVETEFARYPGESHLFPWYGIPAHRIDFLTRTLAWFKRFLGDPVETAV